MCLSCWDLHDLGSLLLSTGLGENGFMPFQKSLVRSAWAAVFKPGFSKKTTQDWARWALGQSPAETDGCVLWQQRQNQLSGHLKFAECLMAPWSLCSLGFFSSPQCLLCESNEEEEQEEQFFLSFISQQNWGLDVALTWNWGLGRNHWSDNRQSQSWTGPFKKD